jgi:hypothetical protein
MVTRGTTSAGVAARTNPESDIGGRMRTGNVSSSTELQEHSRETFIMQDQAFFKDVMGRIGCDLRRAEGLTFAVFQELRDRITPNEALHVAAQLPKRLKMMWMSLEHPDRKVHRVSGEQFI